MVSPFAPILTVAEIMRDFPSAWFVSGGWAIDLFLGQPTRSHFDIEIGIYRRDQQTIKRLLPEWNLEKSISTPTGGKWVPWTDGEELHLPIH